MQSRVSRVSSKGELRFARGARDTRVLCEIACSRLLCRFLLESASGSSSGGDAESSCSFQSGCIPPMSLQRSWAMERTEKKIFPNVIMNLVISISHLSKRMNFTERLWGKHRSWPTDKTYGLIDGYSDRWMVIGQGQWRWVELPRDALGGFSPMFLLLFHDVDDGHGPLMVLRLNYGQGCGRRAIIVIQIGTNSDENKRGLYWLSYIIYDNHKWSTSILIWLNESWKIFPIWVLAGLCTFASSKSELPNTFR